MQASEKDTMPKDDQKDEDVKKEANGEKNGEKTAPVEATEDKQKLSLGEIAAIDAEISKAKTEQLQVLHNVCFEITFFYRMKKLQLITSLLVNLREERHRPSDKAFSSQIRWIRRGRETEESRPAACIWASRYQTDSEHSKPSGC